MIFKLNEIKNNTYSTKETITYFIVGYYNTKSNDTKTIIKSIINQMIKIPQNEILDKSFCGFLNIYGKDIKLTYNQILGYFYIVCDSLLKLNKKVVEFEIIEIFNGILNIYPPKYVENIANTNKLTELQLYDY